MERPGRFAPPAPSPAPAVRWTPARAPRPPGAQDQDPDALRAGRFTFLDREETLGWPPSWAAPGLPHLWQYNLHYFEYLWRLPFAEARELALDWIERHPLGRGQVGWEPYPTSLRLANWCGVFHGRHRARTAEDALLRERLWASVHRQACWLARHLEFHLLGNHLLENAVALAYCGACYEGDAAEAWLSRGLALLERELPEQVLPDGGHFERAPMYQARVAYALGLLADTGHPALRGCVAPALARTLDALAVLCHPDGEIALLNDSATGIANAPAELDPPEPPSGAFALAETGYYGARTPEGHYLVCDAAPIGPDYLPGHAHGDIFSFELSLHGRRALVDTGVGSYEPGEWRRVCRSTAAHNTVEVEGQDQCELWAAFRVARRGRPRDVRFRAEPDGFRLEGWHDGYARLPGRPRHERAFRWHDAGALLVRDRVRSERAVTSRSRLHLHPDCALERVGEHGALVRLHGHAFRVVFAGPGTLALERSPYFPRFGRREERDCLVYSSHGSDVQTGFCVVVGEGEVRYDPASGAELERTRYVW